MESILPVALQAALWGGVAGFALIMGATVGYFIRLPHRLVASVMAFGAGVLMSLLSFELMAEARQQGGLNNAIVGFLIGVAAYSGANAVLSMYGAKHRKRSRKQDAANDTGAGTAIALGALLDGIPEAAVIGMSLLEGEGVALVTVFAIFISNVPEGLSSSAGMRRAGRSARYVFGLWISIALTTAAAASLGYALVGNLGASYIAEAQAIAAGAIFVMIVQTMIPEAFEDLHGLTGPIAAIGFLIVFWVV